MRHLLPISKKTDPLASLSVEDERVWKDPKSVMNSIEKIKMYLDRVESDINGYLQTVTPEELKRKFERKFTSVTVTLTVEDALIDIFQEETHHYGEFIALLWQMKIEPPHLGWSRYLIK